MTSYFLFQPVLHDWCKKGHCMPMHMKHPLLLIGKRITHEVEAVGFLSHYLSGPLPYIISDAK